MDLYTPISLLAVIVYLAAGLGLALGHYHGRRGLRQLATAAAAAGIVLHGLSLGSAMATPEGWDINFVHTLSLTAWLIALVLLVTTAWTHTLEAGIVAFPGAAVCVAAQWLVPIEPLLLGDFPVVLELHVFSSLLAYCLLSIAAINAVMLAVQDYALRHPRTIRQLELLPPLAVIESIMFRLILTGWLVLTASLLTGLIYLDNLLAQHLAHKTVLSILSWTLFGLLLFGRWRLGWRGRRAVHWTLAAMAVLVLAYFGSRLVLEIFLGRSWTLPPGA